MKNLLIICVGMLVTSYSYAQETLQTVTDRGNTTTNSIQIGGGSVNANTTKLLINNPYGKNWALSSGANMISEMGFHIYNWTDSPGTPFLSISNNGNVGIGSYDPQASLDIFRTYDANRTKALKMFYQGSWGYVPYANNFRFLDIASTEGGKILQVNGYGIGIGVDPPGISSPDKLYVDGNVGVGTISPIGKFDVRGNAFIGTPDLVLGNTGSFVQIDQGAVNGNTYSRIRAFSHGGTSVNNLAVQTSGGNFGVGTTVPDEKLTVKGKIHAEEVKVEISVPGPDYVFEKDYPLASLSDIQTFVAKNKHLPEVPSAKEMAEKGISLGEMNMLLLKKVEELTLHLIEMKQEIEQLKTKLQ